MNLKDSLVAGVTRNKFNELVVKFKVKQEDYSSQEYEVLRDMWEQGLTVDLAINGAESTIEKASNDARPAAVIQTINTRTGEII